MVSVYTDKNSIDGVAIPVWVLGVDIPAGYTFMGGIAGVVEPAGGDAPSWNHQASCAVYQEINNITLRVVSHTHSQILKVYVIAQFDQP